MKNLMFLLLLLPLTIFCQAVDAPSMWEVVHIKVKEGQEKQFEEIVKAHDKKFHGEGLYNAHLTYNLNGPYAGMYSWIMGATSFTALDNRPGKGAHDDDWKAVTALTESAMSPTYWSNDPKLSHLVSNPLNTKRLIWMYDLEKGQSARWSELVGKVKRVYDEKRPTESMGVFWNEFSDTKAGQDVAIVFYFEKWAWMDRKSTFSKEYEEIFGEGSYRNFLNEIGATVKGRVDWMREVVK